MSREVSKLITGNTVVMMSFNIMSVVKICNIVLNLKEIKNLVSLA